MVSDLQALMSSLRIDRRWLYALVILYCLSACVFSLWYLANSHDALLRWYFSLHDWVYDKEGFINSFFTPATKARGNVWCVGGIVAALSLTGYTGWKWKRTTAEESFAVRIPAVQPLIFPVLIIMIAAGLWGVGHYLLPPMPDELYSANNIAATHPFQALSYYMQVNNHILLNVINSLFFRHAADRVLTGRLISLAAYLVTAVWTYYLFLAFLKQRFSAFMATVLVICQMPLWGFSFANRGYEICSMAGWLTLGALFYYQQSRNHAWMRLLGCSIFIGYTVLPSFLFMHMGVLTGAAGIQLVNRKIDWHFWRYQVITGMLILLFYLPCFSFSGIGAITSNRHVMTWVQHYNDLPYFLYRTMRYYLDIWFWGDTGRWKWFSYLFFILPVLFLFSKAKEQRIISQGFIILWLGVMITAFCIRNFAPPRALSPEFNISLALSVASLYFLLRQWGEKTGSTVPQRILFPVLMLLSAVYLMSDNTSHIALMLYGK